MISEWGFPKSLIAVEKGVPPLKRRIDLLCYAPVKGELIPLLIVECKAHFLNEAAERQLLGYNGSIGAPFLCLASGERVNTFWRQAGGIASVPFLPTYTELLQKIPCS
jgi:hypothetical protein